MNNVTYKNCATLINAGAYNHDEMISFLALFVMIHAITSEECTALVTMMETPQETEIVESGEGKTE